MGGELKQDSLLVYYSIDDGEYQAAKMTATANTDEYVAYIKDYKPGSKVNYYVFAADESGRNRQQPVFGEMDPHNFVMEGEDNIAENNIEGIDVYPNPVNDMLFVETESNVVEISIYDVFGRQHPIANSQHLTAIDVSELNAGVYMVKIITEKGEFVNRFVKK